MTRYERVGLVDEGDDAGASEDDEGDDVEASEDTPGASQRALKTRSAALVLALALVFATAVGLVFKHRISQVLWGAKIDCCWTAVGSKLDK